MCKHLMRSEVSGSVFEYLFSQAKTTVVLSTSMSMCLPARSFGLVRKGSRMPTVSRVALFDPNLALLLLRLLNMRLSGQRTIAINVTSPSRCSMAAAPRSPDLVVF
jgi:hypothetical protein